MHRFARSFFGIAVLGSLMMTDTARPEALNAGLRQRMDKAAAEAKRLRSERNESVALVKSAEALLAKALRAHPETQISVRDGSKGSAEA